MRRYAEETRDKGRNEFGVKIGSMVSVFSGFFHPDGPDRAPPTRLPSWPETPGGGH